MLASPQLPKHPFKFEDYFGFLGAESGNLGSLLGLHVVVDEHQVNVDWLDLGLQRSGLHNWNRVLVNFILQLT